MNEELVKRAYARDTYFVIMTPDGIFFAESPDEQGLEEGDPPESLLRLFSNEEDAKIYCEYVQINYGDVRVTQVTLKDVWYLIDDIEALSAVQFDCPVRIALCALDEDGWPYDLDTLYSYLMLPS